MQGKRGSEGCCQSKQIVFMWMVEIIGINTACFSLSLALNLCQIEV